MKKAIITTILATIGIFTFIVAVLSAAGEAPAFGSSVSKNYRAGSDDDSNNASSKMVMENNSGIMNMMHANVMAMKKGMIERGNIAMGFNQSKIMHHFIATPSGGEIMIVALNNSDNNTIKQIRDHVMDI